MRGDLRFSQPLPYQPQDLDPTGSQVSGLGGSGGCGLGARGGLSGMRNSHRVGLCLLQRQRLRRQTQETRGPALIGGRSCQFYWIHSRYPQQTAQRYEAKHKAPHYLCRSARRMRLFDGNVGSSALRALSTPATGRVAGSSKPSCTNTDA
jgi:hypothetical protein